MNIARVYSDAAGRRTSRNIAHSAVCALVALVVAQRSAAQAAPGDSLAERLRRAEAAIAALQTQVAEQSQSGVRARSGVQLELHGRVIVTGFGNSRRVNNVDNPQFVQPDIAPSVPGVSRRGVGMGIRQTQLGLAITGARALGAAFTGDLDVDFYGGQVPSSGGRTFPLIRMRTARGILQWQYAQLLIGQESPLISGVNPMTPAALGTPEFAAAGNLWLWLPQVRFGVETHSGIRVGMQGAVLAPTSGDPAAPFDTELDLAERSGRPYLQGRGYAKWGEGALLGEFGCGVHHGWLIPALTRETSQAVACDLVLPVAEWLELRGEGFSGQGLRGLGGGGIGQNFTGANVPLRGKGGWAQVNYRPTEFLRLGAGCGIDHPEALSLRRRNDACSAYVMARPGGPMFFGAELRRIRTAYSATRYTSDHVTLTAGFGF